VVRFREVRWDDWSEDHIGHRGIGLDDVEDVVLFPPRYVCRGRDGKTLVYGTQTAGGTCWSWWLRKATGWCS
jgi:hypothetical protein